MGAVEAGARGIEPGELGADMSVDRLVDKRERRLETVFAAIERGREAPVRAEAAEGEDRAATAAAGIGDQPLQLAHLITAPATRAEAAIFLHPDAETRQLADGRRALGQQEVGKGLD